MQFQGGQQFQGGLAAMQAQGGQQYGMQAQGGQQYGMQAQGGQQYGMEPSSPMSSPGGQGVVGNGRALMMPAPSSKQRQAQGGQQVVPAAPAGGPYTGGQPPQYTQGQGQPSMGRAGPAPPPADLVQGGSFAAPRPQGQQQQWQPAPPAAPRPPAFPPTPLRYPTPGGSAMSTPTAAYQYGGSPGSGAQYGGNPGSGAPSPGSPTYVTGSQGLLLPRGIGAALQQQLQPLQPIGPQSYDYWRHNPLADGQQEMAMQALSGGGAAPPGWQAGGAPPGWQAGGAPPLPYGYDGYGAGVGMGQGQGQRQVGADVGGGMSGGGMMMMGPGPAFLQAEFYLTQVGEWVCGGGGRGGVRACVCGWVGGWVGRWVGHLVAGVLGFCCVAQATVGFHLTHVTPHLTHVTHSPCLPLPLPPPPFRHAHLISLSMPTSGPTCNRCSRWADRTCPPSSRKCKGRPLNTAW